MSDKKLESFKAGSKQKPKTVGRPKKQEAESAPESHTLGFARIEAILEREEPGAVMGNLNELLSELSQFEANAKTPKDKAAAKKGKAAIERTVDLLEYLFRTKEAMIKAQSNESNE